MNGYKRDASQGETARWHYGRNAIDRAPRRERGAFYGQLRPESDGQEFNR